jgi:putative membrane protein
MRKERILHEAQFSPSAVRYHVLSSIVALGVTVVGIPLIPVIAPIVYWYYTRYYRRLRVVLTSRELKVRHGIMVVTEKSIPLEKITDLAVYQGPVMRAMDLKGIRVETPGQTSGPGSALVSIQGILDTDSFRDLVLEQRDRIADRDDTTVLNMVDPSPPIVAAKQATASATAAANGTAGTADPALMTILTEIRDLLRRIEEAASRSGKNDSAT